MRTRILAGLAVLLLCIALPCPAADYFHLRNYVTNTYGTAIGGASVQVYNPNTTTNPTAYSDLAGATAVSWPLSTDSNGMFECYLAQGNYDIYIVHTGHAIDTTWDNYMVGTGSDTQSYSFLDVSGDIRASGTVEAGALDAEDWILAGGPFTGQTLETTGLLDIGTTVTTGGTVTIGGDLYVTDQTWLSYDDVAKVYSFRLNNNLLLVQPFLQVDDHIVAMGNLYAYGKGDEAGTVYAEILMADTLRADDLYHREDDGGNEAVFHTRFLQLEPVDITGGLPDTSDFGLGTLFYATDDSFRYLAGAGIAKEWRTLANAGYVAGADNPELYLPTIELNYTYADSHVQKFGVGNSGEGILPWTSSFISDWIAEGTGLDQHDGAADTGTVGAGYDSVTVKLMWAQIAQGASLHDTIDVTTDYGNGQVVINADGEPFTGQDYVVEPNHPRLFFNEDELATLRAKCYSAERIRFDTFMANVDGHVETDVYPFEQLAAQATLVTRFAFAYVATQDTTYLAQQVECIDSIFSEWPTTWYNDHSMEKGLPLFYDWCYNDMGATRRSHFGDSLGVMLERQHAAANYSTNAAHSQIVVIAPIMYMALAAHGDGLADTDASAALDSIYAHTFGDHHMMAILDSIGRDGGSFEGMDYGDPDGEATLFWQWDHGTDKDPWATSSNIVGWSDYLLYNVSARTEVAPDFDAFGSSKMADDAGHASGRADQMLLANQLATAYDDSLLIWLSDQYDDYTSGTANSYDYWEHIVYQDTVMTAVAPTERTVDYPSAKQFDLAAVFMREGWDLSPGSTDIWATYRHTQFQWGHGDASCGSFVIGRGHDLLLIESGEYDGCPESHRKNYATQTIASNAITVKRSGAYFGGYENSGGQYLSDWGCGVFPITVGDYTDSLAGSGNVGTITDYAHRADTLTYMRSDLTPAYSAATVDTVRREFVWMEPDGVFLVFDYAAVDSTGYLQKSLFHTINNPTDNGNATWTVVHGDSEVTLRFLGNDSVAEVGGAGSEFEVNGTNYPPSGSHSDNGAYRLEAIMSRNVDQRWLLTIIETSAEGGADYGTVSFVTDITGYVGAAVNGDTVLFHRYGGAYQYREQ